jgi:hypothetical protein
MSFGSPVSRIDETTWICNLFAVPLAEDSSARHVGRRRAFHVLAGNFLLRVRNARNQQA